MFVERSTSEAIQRLRSEDGQFAERVGVYSEHVSTSLFRLRRLQAAEIDEWQEPLREADRAILIRHKVLAREMLRCLRSIKALKTRLLTALADDNEATASTILPSLRVANERRRFLETAIAEVQA